MKVDLFILVFVGYFVRLSESGGHGGKHVHVKIIVPIQKHTHKHTHTIYKKPVEHKRLIIHKHHHKHGHGHKHGHKHCHKHKHGHQHKDGHQHGHKHKHHHLHKHKGGHHHYNGYNDDWAKHAAEVAKEDFKPSPLIDSYGIVPTFNDINYSGPEQPENVDEDGYLNEHKSLRSETFHITEAKNSAANDPIGKHFVTGSYRVEQADPNDVINTKVHKVFQAPLANINLHETSYEHDKVEGTGEYDQDEEVDGEGGDYEEDDHGTEDYDYAGALGLNQGDGESQKSVYGIEALKQFFHNKV